MKKLRLIIGIIVVAVASAGVASARELTVGLASAPTSIDPHLRNVRPNNAMASHIFDSLVHQDEKQNLIPGLAVSWKTVDATTWEFELRGGVKFHDGSAFTADDVIFSFDRVSGIGNDAGGFETYTRGKKLIKVDDLTLRIKTERPEPLMPQDVSAIRIVSDEIGRDAKSSDFNTGLAAIGTGPYRFVQYVPGERVVFERNEAFWGNKPEWTKVTFKVIDSGKSRVAALIAGDVDIIEQPPVADIGQFKREANFTVNQVISHRLVYLHMDQFREDSPFIKGKDGRSIVNPLLDARVRKAISRAIDRNDLVQEVMQGAAVEAGQLVPEGFFGRTPSLLPQPYDPEGARKLLAEAGLDQGFKLTLHGPNDRYMKDAEIAEAVGRMLTRVGIDTEVVTMPGSEYFKHASRGGENGRPEFSMLLAGWGSGTGEASSPLGALLHSYDKERGFGIFNRGRHADPEVDKLIEQALVTLDNSKRYALLAEATELAIGRNQGIIPLHFQVNTWIARKGVRYRARSDERTVAYGVYSE